MDPKDKRYFDAARKLYKLGRADTLESGQAKQEVIDINVYSYEIAPNAAESVIGEIMDAELTPRDVEDWSAPGHWTNDMLGFPQPEENQYEEGPFFG